MSKKTARKHIRSILWFLRYGMRNAITLWRGLGFRLKDAISIEWQVAYMGTGGKQNGKQ